MLIGDPFWLHLLAALGRLLRFFVASAFVQVLLLRAKHLFVAAMVADCAHPPPRR
jgi:hypothetical protein